MHTNEPDRSPATRGERWGYALFALVLLGLLTGEVIRDYRPVKLSMLFITLAWIPLLAIHEAGHAAVARLLGWRVLGVVLGMGRPLWRVNVGGIPVELRAIPIEGFTLPLRRARTERGPNAREITRARLESVLVYLGGVLAELAVLGLLALLVGPTTLLTRTDQVGLIAAQSFAAAALLGVVINLVPHTAQTSHGETANDGLGVIRSLLAPTERFRELLERDPD